MSMILEPKTNEKTTSLSPKSSQSDEGIEKGPQAKLNWVLFENKGPGPTFHPNPAWVEHKQQKKDQAKRNIQDIWAEQTIFVKNSGFRNPQHPSQMYPQFFADEERNLRLARAKFNFVPEKGINIQRNSSNTGTAHSNIYQRPQAI